MLNILLSFAALVACQGFDCGCSPCSFPSFSSGCGGSSCAPPPPPPPPPCPAPAPSPCASQATFVVPVTYSAPSPCQLPPPPRHEAAADQFNFHRDSANCQGAQDSMRANANDHSCNSRNADVASCDNARVKADANLCSNNNQFTESNFDEVLCHKKKARTECGDSSARSANIDMDAGKNCRAAQRYNDNRQNQFCAGRDNSCRAEDSCHNDINGCRSRSNCFTPRGFDYSQYF
ncbi:uncharacterized protein MONOS_8971 [Monocercomonoides exilis]|uniref:uncharacterized protein n=1 Tax=Monocercomonoides exilis TaxID=2049356 RepID=UPI00355949FC|nr:hypothetical protein MONOS_8971 [Monocercomonoides exilis]|eukprot:MONOS_8971.1-p1 / transcript=MONOS_8971.1 / gene=MONOS_8971 / organism=Monocercomonoides_exilis_PA203 / gene_product=unspecified product / transcript_product=unspecified product / location=Mono_scaffold00354:30347-31048(+) / protein_length=234 / sequence_SO=supercontig / SO=protein_coding / is_pseudo=false